MNRKEVPFERVLFFSDAVVAIAITLLALDLRLEVPEGRHITFSDLLSPWKNYLAFLLAFINIAGVWRMHHRMYSHINKMNDNTLSLNVGWLFFVVTLPFATSVLSTHFGDAPAIFLYSLNSFLISILQNYIWDTADLRQNFIDEEHISTEERGRFRLMLNLDMFNGLLAVILSLILPKLAFFFLFFKIPIFIIGTFYVARLRRHER